MVTFLRQSGNVITKLAPLVVLLVVSVAHAQQPLRPVKRSPSLTTEDMPKSTAVPAPEAGTDSAADKTGDSDGTNSPPPAGDGKVTSEELAWRDQVAKARDRVKAEERTAEEGELRITALRNQLAASGQTPQSINETAAQLTQAGQQLTKLREAAKMAANELAQLLETGRLKKYSEVQAPGPTLENGAANQDYYKSRYGELTEALQTAERRVELYDDRVRDASQRILTAGGKNGGDSYYLAHLQEERQDAQKLLEEARTASAKARADLDALKEEARRAGVPPGVFR
ncbi:MAG TPA: hypothetical protein VNS63_20405 [Blastocatellia bacterium]|nr:hypothetical protein [Blastocatellia bacterium]